MPPNNSVLPTVSIVVPALNESEYVERCIESLLALDYPKGLVKITLVDNGSTDDTVKIAERYPITVLIKKGGKVGGVRNFGVDNSNGEVLAFIDADCVASALWLKAAILNLNKDIGAIGGDYLLRDQPSWVEAAWVINNTPTSAIVGSLLGGSFILTRKLFNSLGGFDEEINAGEDTKLTKQVINAGYKAIFEKDCAVVHLGYPSTVADFVKRQFWHSSSYLKSNNGLFNDKTFVFVLLFLFSLTSLFIALISSNSLFYIGTIFLFISPLVFGWNRIKKSGVKTISFRLRLQVFLLDFLYFSARGAGLIASVFGDPFKK